MKRLSALAALVRKNVQSYRFNSLFLRMVVLIVAAIALPLMGAVVAIYSFSQSLLVREIETANQRSLQLSLNVVDMFVQEAQSVALRLAVDEDVLRMLRQGAPTMFSDFSRINQVKSIMELSRKDALIDSLYLYNHADRYLLSTLTGGSRLQFSLDPSMADTYESLAGHNAVWIRRQMPVTTGATGNTAWVLTLFRRVAVMGVEGMVAVNIRDAQLSALLGGGGNSVVLIDSSGTILYDQSGRYGGQQASHMLPDAAGRLAAASQGAFAVDIDGERKMLTYAQVPATGWICANITPYRTYTQRSDALRAFLATSLVVAVLLALLLAFALAVRLYRPIEAVLSFIHSPTQTPSAPVDGELSAILMHLVSVYDENQHLEEELLHRYSTLRDAQARSLKAQITPHFLHNTLQAVQWQVLRETGNESSPACRALVALSDMARQSMDDSSALNTLGEELDYVERFISLQHMRYGDGLRYETDIPAGLRDTPVPRMSVQPLIENAIEHGLGRRYGHGLVRVAASLQGGDMVLEVSDDGEGMDAAAMEGYNRSFGSEGSPLSRHIGLSNLNQRIRLLCGDGYGLSLTCPPQGGLTVTMRVPFAGQAFQTPA